MNFKFKTCVFILALLYCVMSCADGEVRTKQLNFNGYTVYYEVRGSSEKTIVFIHGWTSSIQSWKYQLDAFQDYKVIAIDLPGNGKSSKKVDASYSMELFADSIIAVLNNEGIKNAVFIGHSMGFAVIELLTVKYPEFCIGLCSVDGTHFELPDDPQESENWLQYNREFAQSMEQEEGREFFINMLFLPDTPQLLKDEVFAVSRTVPLTIAKAMIEGVETDKKYWKAKVINIPCLAVYSPAFGLPPDYNDTLRKTFPQLEYHSVENVSHFLMLEIPYKVNQMIYDFLLKIYK